MLGSCREVVVDGVVVPFESHETHHRCLHKKGRVDNTQFYQSFFQRKNWLLRDIHHSSTHSLSIL